MLLFDSMGMHVTNYYMQISSIRKIIPISLKKMITSHENARVDAWRFSTGESPKEARAFVGKFLDSPEAAVFHQNPDGGPGVAIFDSSAPLQGLSMFGHEAAEDLRNHMSRHGGQFEDGDILIFQARTAELQGGSTMLGRLRVAMHKAAVAEGLVEQVEGHHYLWVTKFPMFTPNDGVDPGQGGTAGFSATHHPFTAPYSKQDIDLLRTAPLKAHADHYDLVVNGVELGGGSRRIHNVEMQKYIMRDIIKMSEARMADFSHLFDALSAGCPPHAGFAIGFDRMMAVLTGRESVRDVIAFPKSSKGEDLMVKSPSRMTEDNLATYHLALRHDKAELGEGEPVVETTETEATDGTPSTA
jgi:aspartyl-tRNA synthetase